MTFDLTLLSKSQVQHQHIPASFLCARASYKLPRAWPSSSKRFISHQFTPSSVWFFSLSLLAFFFFLKKKIRPHQGSGLVNHSIQGSFPVNQPPRFLFSPEAWTGYQIMAVNASDTNPVHYSPTYKIMTYPPPTLWDLPGPWSRLNASFMGDLLSATLLHYP